MRQTYKWICLALACTIPAVGMAGCSASKSENMTNEPKYLYQNGDLACDEENGWYYEGDLNYESYNTIVENGFISAAENPLSTFSVDVDTASYSNVRRMLRNGTEVEPDAVRIEEMINYFSYDYPEPQEGEPFSVTTEMHDCPWNPDTQLMLVGLQAEEIDFSDRVPMNLVFLIDVSGSMYSQDKLPLVQKAMAMLAENLNENDRISIVTYAGTDSVVLEGVPGNDYAKITEAIYELQAGGSTAGAAGIERAYSIAENYFIEGGNNRILLATDGDLNVGPSSQEELKAIVEEKRENGVYLSVLGFGTGNLKDDRMETLADNGNGNYAYIDSELEARKVLVQEMGGTLYTVAKDVKLQAEFNPELVDSYRLIGYENRILNAEDFHNDQVDAGEIGAGHSVTALYEVYMKEETESDAMMNLSIRYKEPDKNESKLLDYPILFQRSTEIQPNLAFAAAVAEYGMLLRQSQYAGLSSYPQIQELLSMTDMSDDYRQEFSELAFCAFAGKPEYDAKTEMPVVIEPQPTESSVTEPASVEEEGEPVLVATHMGNYVELENPERIISILESEIDAQTLMNTIPTDQDFTECAENGWIVEVLYSGYERIPGYESPGKEIHLKGTDDSVYVNEIDVLWNDTHMWAVTNSNGTWNVYALPEWVMDELTSQYERSIGVPETAVSTIVE